MLNLIHGKYGSLLRVMEDGKIKVVRREFGLTWQGPAADGSCSREMHQQIYEYMTGFPCPPGWYAEDPPSVSRPPGEPPLPHP